MRVCVMHTRHGARFEYGANSRRFIDECPSNATATLGALRHCQGVGIHDAQTPLLPLGTLYPAGGGDGSRGFVLPGIDVLDYAGISVSAAGDVNGDGLDDLIAGASGADPGRRSMATSSAAERTRRS